MNNTQDLVQVDKGGMSPMFQDSIMSMLDSLKSQPQQGTDSQSENENLNTFQPIDTSNKKVSSAQTTEQNNNVSENNAMALSDERCKELFGSTDILDAIADIGSYRFRYKEGADKIEPNADPNRERVGILAQDLQKNPAISESVVEQDPSGYLTVNTKELTTNNTALISELARRLILLETRVKELENKCGNQ